MRWSTGGLLLVSFALQGCGPGVQESFELLSYAEQVGSRTPYDRQRFFAAPASRVFACLAGVLDREGAQILTADADWGVLSWCSTATGFVAVPVHLRRQPAVGVAPPVAFTPGIVYGAARLRSTKAGTWLCLNSRARESEVDRMVFSDGSYEHRLFSAIEKSLYGPRPPVSLTITGSPPWPGTAGTTYEQLFSCYFRSLPPLTEGAIQRNGLSKIYPLSPAEVWAACLDVLSQMDVLASASSVDSTAVLLQGMSIPVDQRHLQYCDVLMAFHLEPLGDTGSAVFVAFLSPEGLGPSTIRDVAEVTADERKLMVVQEPRRLAAMLVAQQFFEHLGTQLLHGERWAGKFVARSTPNP